MFNVTASHAGFPLRLGNLEKWEGIYPVSEKSGNFEQTGKVGEFQTNVINDIYIDYELFAKMDQVFS